jgi:hypothetical protein
VMQRLLVGAADIHAGAAADRLQPLEHLVDRRGIAGLGAGRPRGGTRQPARGPYRCRSLRRGPSWRFGFVQVISMAWAWLFECLHRVRWRRRRNTVLSDYADG